MAGVATLTTVLLLKGRPPDAPTVRPDDQVTPKSGGPRIRCPRCAWEPGRDDRWMCSCLHQWNTFDTAGVCPGCGRQWEETQCLRCKEWSRHDDWYVETR